MWAPACLPAGVGPPRKGQVRNRLDLQPGVGRLIVHHHWRKI